ncbi:MAG: hypothetical protein WCF85_20880 [Rhodospirillaceae bacterium]
MFQDTEARGGFWGAVAHHANPGDAYDLARSAIAAATARPDEEITHFLDSRRGYDFGTEIVGRIMRKTALERAIRAAAARLPGQIASLWHGTLVAPAPEAEPEHACIEVVRYADHPRFGRLYWYHSWLHLSFAGGGGESLEHFSLVREIDRASGWSAFGSVYGLLYGGGRHLSFVEHLHRLGKANIGFGSDAEKDALLAWLDSADWRDQPWASSSALDAVTVVRVRITGNADTGFTVHLPGFSDGCTGTGATEAEALLAAEVTLSERLIAIIMAGTQLPALHDAEDPTASACLHGARDAELRIQTPVARRKVLAAAAQTPADRLELGAGLRA